MLIATYLISLFLKTLLFRKIRQINAQFLPNLYFDFNCQSNCKRVFCLVSQICPICTENRPLDIYKHLPNAEDSAETVH